MQLFKLFSTPSSHGHDCEYLDSTLKLLNHNQVLILINLLEKKIMCKKN